MISCCAYIEVSYYKCMVGLNKLWAVQITDVYYMYVQYKHVYKHRPVWGGG